MRSKFLGGFILLAASLLSGQSSDSQSNPEPQQTPPIAVNVKVVNVLACVRDKHGKIIPDLTRADFTLEEDGKPVTIHYFAKETNLPLTLGLLVDTSMSQQDFSRSGSARKRHCVSHPFRQRGGTAAGSDGVAAEA
jgi:hypothetical protein